MDSDERGDWLFVPEVEPIRIVPAQTPREVGGFRIARPFDGVTEDRSRPVVSPERGHVEDTDLRLRMLDYLTDGAVVLDSNVSSDDLFDPRRTFAVKGHQYTDGTWIWTGAEVYYLRYHHVAPEPDFAAHMAAQDYRCPRVAPDVVARARVAMHEALVAMRTAGEEWLRGRGLLAEGDPERFPKEVNDNLRYIGWQPGRDVWAEVEPWLAHWAEELPKFKFTDRGYPAYEPLEPATAVLREFGGLVSEDNLPGVTAARSPFVIFPYEGQGDLIPHILDVVLLADRLGKRLFQVGEIEDGNLALAVAEDGAVYATGQVELYLGANFDDALVVLLEGHQAPFA